jgi:hypothetical protein
MSPYTNDAAARRPKLLNLRARLVRRREKAPRRSLTAERLRKRLTLVAALLGDLRRRVDT